MRKQHKYFRYIRLNTLLLISPISFYFLIWLLEIFNLYNKYIIISNILPTLNWILFFKYPGPFITLGLYLCSFPFIARTFSSPCSLSVKWLYSLFNENTLKITSSMELCQTIPQRYKHHFCVSAITNCMCVCVCVCVCVSSSIMSNSLQLHGLQPARLLCPWNSPVENTGVGCHFHLQWIFQGLNLGFLSRRQIVYHLSHQGSP